MVNLQHKPRKLFRLEETASGYPIQSHSESRINFDQTAQDFVQLCFEARIWRIYLKYFTSGV